MPDVHHLCAYGGPYAGSFVPMLIGTARENTKRGNHTTVWLSRGSREREWVPELAQAARIRWLPDGPGDLHQMRRIAATVHTALSPSRRPAILHSHFSAFDLATLLVAGTRSRSAAIWHEHGRPATGSRARARALVKYGVLGQAVSRILCVSTEITEDLRVRHAPARALVTFPNAIDLGRFQATDDASRRRARTQLGLDPDARVILHFSWDWRRKGGDLLVAAAAQFDDPDVIWLTAPGPGRGDAGDTSERVRSLPARGDVRELYAAADVFVSCSRSEGMPYAMLEALATGLPVVASDLPGHRPALTGLPGAFITTLEPSSIAAGVAQALSLDPPARARHAHAARARIAEEYSLADWARKLGDLYDAALGLNP